MDEQSSPRPQEQHELAQPNCSIALLIQDLIACSQFTIDLDTFLKYSLFSITVFIVLVYLFRDKTVLIILLILLILISIFRVLIERAASLLKNNNHLVDTGAATRVIDGVKLTNLRAKIDAAVQNFKHGGTSTNS